MRSLMLGVLQLGIGFIALSLLARPSSAQDATACQSILNAGVYNTYSSTSSSSSYNAFQSAACQSYSGYTYSQYQLDTSTSQAQGQARSFNVAAGGFGYKASYGQSSSSYFSSSSDFSQAQTQVSSYQQSSCSSSSSTNTLQSNLNNLQQVLNPHVYDAYKSCLAMYQAGVQIWQTNGKTTTSFALNIKFVATIEGSTAAFSGLTIEPAGQATCKLVGNITGIPASALTTFQWNLKPNVVYNINCQLSKSAPTSGGFTNIYLYNTVSGAFSTFLFNKPPANQLTELKSQLVASLSSLQDRVSSLESNLAKNQVAQSQVNTGFASSISSLLTTLNSFYSGGSISVPDNIISGGTVIGKNVQISSTNPLADCIGGLPLLLCQPTANMDLIALVLRGTML